MEARHSSEIFFQLPTVAPFQRLRKLLDCLARDLLCLLDFHVCPPVFGELLLPSPPAEGAIPKQRDKSGEMAASRSQWVASRMTTGFGGVRRASEDCRRGELRAGTQTTRSGQEGEQVKLLAQKRKSREELVGS